MNATAKQTKDPRIEEINNVISQLAAGKLNARGKTVGNNDDLDGIITGLNMLAEELNETHISVIQAEKRLTEIEDVIVAISSRDFSKKTPEFSKWDLSRGSNSEIISFNSKGSK